ncbi:MAG TPA: endonuclease/exonuclease/phosphatase family protein, partial [Burkholderiales bacterium]|nr:endonuclease/exonuclease/phosphatase family protein [Burkholderiales bacterium]
MQIAVIATGFFAIIATLLPLLRSDAWWIRMFDFPRAQIAVIGAASLAGYFYLQPDWGTAGPWFMGALVVCLVRLAYVMFPYTPLARQQVEQSRGSGVRWSLVCANVLMTNRDSQQLVRIISAADPDVILLVEADDWWQQQMRQFETSHRYIVHQPQDNTYGMLLYSRVELIDPNVHFLVQNDIPSIHAIVKLTPELEVELYCLHPRPPFPTEDDESTHRDAELLLVGKKIKGRNKPTVVCGDLNDVAWSRTNDLFQDISGLLDPRLGRGFF